MGCLGSKSQDTTAGKTTNANSEEPTEYPTQTNGNTNAASTGSTNQSELKTTGAVQVSSKADSDGLIFQPGPAGLTFHPDGIITQVLPKSQAEQKGLQEGMQILTVDGKPFDGSWMMERIKGNSAYVLGVAGVAAAAHAKFFPGQGVVGNGKAGVAGQPTSAGAVADRTLQTPISSADSGQVEETSDGLFGKKRASDSSGQGLASPFKEVAGDAFADDEVVVVTELGESQTGWCTFCFPSREAKLLAARRQLMT
jgi:membrane-associated protease RseP (regulator of RpoE activity)